MLFLFEVPIELIQQKSSSTIVPTEYVFCRKCTRALCNSNNLHPIFRQKGFRMVVKEERYNINVHHHRTRIIDFACLVWIFCLFIPYSIVLRWEYRNFTYFYMDESNVLDLHSDNILRTNSSVSRTNASCFVSVVS